LVLASTLALITPTEPKFRVFVVIRQVVDTDAPTVNEAELVVQSSTASPASALLDQGDRPPIGMLSWGRDSAHKTQPHRLQVANARVLTSKACVVKVHEFRKRQKAPVDESELTGLWRIGARLGLIEIELNAAQSASLATWPVATTGSPAPWRPWEDPAFVTSAGATSWPLHRETFCPPHGGYSTTSSA
jgi:hypothetical protein